MLGAALRGSALDLIDEDPEARAEAEAWFASPEDRPPGKVGGMAYRWICDCYGIDADWLFRKLREWAEEQCHRKSENRERRKMKRKKQPEAQDCPQNAGIELVSSNEFNPEKNQGANNETA